MPKPKQVIAAYVPVIHRGYLQLFDAFSEAKELYVFGQEITEHLDYIRKDLRALSADDQLKLLRGLDRFDEVQVLHAQSLRELDQAGVTIHMPDEDISRAVGSDFKVAKIDYYPIFLRWDRQTLEEIEAKPDETISTKQFDRQFMAQSAAESGKSSDIWRHVGALLVDASGNEISRAHNAGQPSEHSPWALGDPRNAFSRGVAIETSMFTHAEARLIAEAARDGKSLKGASIYVTTFPCPPCAKLIAHSGIKTCYYATGYAVLDGQQIMNEYGIKLVRVAGFDGPDNDARRLVPYDSA